MIGVLTIAPGAGAFAADHELDTTESVVPNSAGTKVPVPPVAVLTSAYPEAVGIPAEVQATPDIATTAPPTVAAAPDLCSATTLPMGECASGPAVAAIQGRLNITVDCDFGGQTVEAVRTWQAESAQPVTGIIDAAGWALLDVPTTWGTDADRNGTIEPAEVTLVCGGDVALPAPPVDTTGWPTTTLALVAQFCGISAEWTSPGDDAPDHRYNPDEDTITIYGAGAGDYPQRGDEVFDTLICVLGGASVPDRVVSQISSTRALDGMQFAEWDDMAAQWTYHPDAGMSMTIWGT